MMSIRLKPKANWLRLALTAVGALASAAAFGAVVASLLTIEGAGARTPLQNPFETTGSAK